MAIPEAQQVMRFRAQEPRERFLPSDMKSRKKKTVAVSPGLRTGIPDDPECRSPSQFGKTAYLVLLTCNAIYEKNEPGPKRERRARNWIMPGGVAASVRASARKEGRAIGEELLLVIVIVISVDKKRKV